MEISRKEALETLAIDISRRFPVSTKAVYDALRNLLKCLETAMELSIVTGHDASILMDYAVNNVAASLKEKASSNES